MYGHTPGRTPTQRCGAYIEAWYLPEPLMVGMDLDAGHRQVATLRISARTLETNRNQEPTELESED